MRTYEKSLGVRHYRDYTEKNVANVAADVNNSISKNVAAATFKTSRSTHVNKYVGRHAKSLGRPTIFTHEGEQLNFKS